MIGFIFQPITITASSLRRSPLLLLEYNIDENRLITKRKGFIIGCSISPVAEAIIYLNCVIITALGSAVRVLIK